ncbi:MAG: ROK family protein [Algisphaera sp.]
MNNSKSLGIDIGGTNIKAVRVDASGKVQKRLDTPTPSDRDVLVATVRDLVKQLEGHKGPIGVASPGLAASDNRSIRWMRGRLEAVEGLAWPEALGQPAVVLNDVHAATMGEAWVGAATGLQHVVMLTLGTGVGGGAICNGQLLQGAFGRAGHLGHITLDLDGPVDIVKTPGSLEDWVGNHNVQARTGFESTAKLVAAVAQGNAQAAKHWDRTLHALTCGIVSLINVFDPQAIVLGGGIAKAGEEALFKPLREKLDRYEWRPLDQPVPILPAEMGDLAGAVGAARFAMMQLF